MGAQAALENEVIAIASTSPPYPSPTLSGSWTPGLIQYTTCDKLKVNQKPVISKAECTFVSLGVDSATGAQVTASEKVELTPQSTQLKVKKADLLVMGDSVTSPQFGHQLKVQIAPPKKLSTN